MKYYILKIYMEVKILFVMDLICILLQASEETGHKRSTRATIDVTVSGTNDFDPVVTSSSGNFIGTISEDADAGTPLRAQGSTDAIQLVVTDQDVVGLFFVYSVL